MKTRYGPLGLTLMFTFVLVAAPVGIGADTVAIEQKAARAASIGTAGDGLVRPFEMGHLIAWHTEEDAFPTAALNSIFGLLDLHNEDHGLASELDAAATLAQDDADAALAVIGTAQAKADAAQAIADAARIEADIARIEVDAAVAAAETAQDAADFAHEEALAAYNDANPEEAANRNVADEVEFNLDVVD
jgi:hypothetical protein